MTAPMTGPMTALHVLAVDDELPALEELSYLLGDNEHVGTVSTAAAGPEALRVLQSEPIDAVFLDIRMPTLDGLEIARVLARFARPPQIVFVTAYDDFAVEAFDLKACDYLLKPLRPERVAEAARRVAEAVTDGSSTRSGGVADETIPVELGGITRFVSRSDVRYVEAQGDYVRMRTADGSHLLRIPLSALEQRWADARFVRIHRRYLIALPHIDELRWEGGRASVRIGDRVFPVSRRHTRELRDRLVGRVRPVRGPRGGGTA